MVIHDSDKNALKIEIPLASLEELSRYQNGLLGILRRIRIEGCDAGFQEDLKTVYSLLSHMLPDKNFSGKCTCGEIIVEHNGDFIMVK